MNPDLPGFIFFLLHRDNTTALHYINLLFLGYLSPVVLLLLFCSRRGTFWARTGFALLGTAFTCACLALFIHFIANPSHEAEREQATSNDIAAVLLGAPSYHYTVTPDEPTGIVRLKTWKEEPSGRYMGTVQLPTISDEHQYSFSTPDWDKILELAQTKP